MSSGLRDPNNHVPEVAPEDDWEDVADFNPSRHIPGGILPPKRKSNDTSALKFPTDTTVPLRIEPEAPLRLDDSYSEELEIREFSGEVIRLSPEATKSSKIARQVVFEEKPVENLTQKRTTGEGAEWGNAKKKSNHWLISTGIGITVIIIVSLLLQPTINESNTIHALPGGPTVVIDPEEPPIEGMGALNKVIARQSQAERIFTTFACANHPDDFLPWIRDAETLAPVIRAKGHQALAPGKWKPPEECIWSIIECGRIPCGLLETTLPDSSNYSAYFVLDGDRMRLDWKATTGYCSAPYAELLQRRGDSREIRGWIDPSNFYSSTFPEAEFRSYRLLSPDKNETLWCYTRRNSIEDHAIARLFSNGEIIEISNEPQKVTVRLEPSRPEAFPNQRLIGKLLHKEWINP